MSREKCSHNNHEEIRESGIWAEINHDDSPYTVHGPNYSLNLAALEDQKIGIPRYNLDYGLDYPYNYVPDNRENSDYAQPEFAKFRKLPPQRPPIPTSEIPHSRNMTCWESIIDFLLDYWRHLLVGFGVLMVMLVALLVMFFMVWEPERKIITVEPSTSTTTKAPTCPIGFQFIHDKCWMFMNQRNTTLEAQTVCATYGAHLVTLKNSTENYSLADFAGTHSSLWIGLECCGDEAAFCQWIDGGGWLKDEPITYPFDECNPNWFNGQCVYYSSGKWTSDKCDLDQMPFVCEIAKTSSAQFYQSPVRRYPHYCGDKKNQRATRANGTEAPCFYWSTPKAITTSRPKR